MPPIWQNFWKGEVDGMWNNAFWLKVPQEEIAEKKIYQFDLTGRFAYFRCDLELPEGARLTVDITASSRYRLFVNGQSVLSGPCKGDSHRQYYETLELTPYLQRGQNTFCAQVLYNDPNTTDSQVEERACIYGVMGPAAGHRLAVEGEVRNEQGDVIAAITTGQASWRVWLDNTFYLKSTEDTQFLGAVTEDIDFSTSPAHWKEPAFDPSGWPLAEQADSVVPRGLLYFAGVQPRFRVHERPIPLLYEREETFAGFAEPITLAPGESRQIILDAGRVVNGYPRYRLSGRGAAEFVYFEKYGGPGSNLRRDDPAGAVTGLRDRIRLPGEALSYEPFWVRTFRFIAVTLRAGDGSLTLEQAAFRRTGYPLEPETSLASSAPWVAGLWEICLRTLGNCMLETYMDCPYYEQLQFAMDTRLEALYTYAVTRDRALARKALLDYHYGMLPEGLTPGKYPSAYLQILSTFSLHYVIMLSEYLEETGDLELLRICRQDIDRVLGYFEDRLGPDGLLGRLDYWEFVDWHPKWNVSYGMPEAVLRGSSTIINLMYAYALRCGGKLQRLAGRACLAEEYETRRAALLAKVQQLCWDGEKQLYREGPAFSQFSHHAQAWAVLNSMLPKEEARALLGRVLRDPDALECSFSTAFEWFRALEWAGMYEEMGQALNSWIGLLDLNCTTCPETPRDARSDCHAWSALPIYELTHTLAGVKWSGDRVWIQPQLWNLSDLYGTVRTPRGTVRLRYEKDGSGLWQYHLTLPEGMTCEFTAQSGRTFLLKGGENHLKD